MIEKDKLYIDKQKENGIFSGADAAPEHPDSTENQIKPPLPTPNSKAFITAGERLHNEVTYRIIDWVINSTIGVGVAYWSTKTKSGQEHFAKPVSNFFKALLKPILKSEKSLAEGAKWGSMFTSIIVGGTAIIPPVMYMEKPHVKKEIIHWLDERWYGKQMVENDPKFEEAYQRIENEPRQGFWTGWAARITVLAPMIAATVYHPTNNFMIKHLYDPIAKGTKWIAHNMGIKPGKMLTEGEYVHPQGNPNLPKKFQSNWDFLHTTIGFDLGLTFIYSFAHEIAYKTLAALGMKETESGAPASETRHVAILPVMGNEVVQNAAKQNFAQRITPHAGFTDYAQLPEEGAQQAL